MSLQDIEKSDFVMVAGVDPINEAPMLALALRQAYRRGARVVVIDPRPVFLPFEFDHLPVSADGINLCLNLLSKSASSRQASEGQLPAEASQFYDHLTCEYPDDQFLQDRLVVLGRELQDCRNPVIVCGTEIVRETTPALAADHARLLKMGKGQAGLFYVLPGPNTFGAAMLEGQEDEDPLEALENGLVKALLIVESDPCWSYPDQERLTRALDNLELLVVMDYLPSATVARADIFLPTVTVFEKGFSHYVNQEGRLQQAAPLHQGGQPIMQVSGGGHPPRIFLDSIPGGELRSAAEILASLGNTLTDREEDFVTEDIWGWLSQEHELFGRFASLNKNEREAGMRLLTEESAISAFSDKPSAKFPEASADKLELLLVEQTFGTEELAGYSPVIQKVEEEPHLILHTDTAAELGLAAGDQVAVHLPGGEVNVSLTTATNMARQVAILPRHRRLAWQKIPDWPVWLAKEDFKKR